MCPGRWLVACVSTCLKCVQNGGRGTGRQGKTGLSDTSQSWKVLNVKSFGSTSTYPTGYLIPLAQGTHRYSHGGPYSGVREAFPVQLAW